VEKPTVYKEWKPSTPIELAADEGFVTFAATESPTSDDKKETQTQVHQSVFTWTGWSLAIQPNFAAFNQLPASTAQDDDRHLSIYPKYTLWKRHSLPPLRFNTDYSFRCRVVDIAGNSARSEDISSDAAIGKPLTQFSRHEPIR